MVGKFIGVLRGCHYAIFRPCPSIWDLRFQVPALSPSLRTLNPKPTPPPPASHPTRQPKAAHRKCLIYTKVEGLDLKGQLGDEGFVGFRVP